MTLLLLAWFITIPDHCLEPMIRMWESRNLWALGEPDDAPYRQLLQVGHLELGGCSIGFDHTVDLTVPMGVVQEVGGLIRKTQDPIPVREWMQSFFTTGCAVIGQGRICREGFT